MMRSQARDFVPSFPNKTLLVTWHALPYELNGLQQGG